MLQLKMLSTLFMELGCLASYGFLLTLLIFLFLLGSRAVQCFFFYRLFKKHGIPGPQPSMFSGNHFELRGQGTLPHEVIGNWLEKYGKVFGYFDGRYATMVIKDMEILKETMIRRSNDFIDRMPMTISVKPLVDSVLYAKGEKWKHDRKLLTPSFSSSKMKTMTQAMNKRVDILVNVLEDYAEKDEVFDMCEHVQALTLDVIGECALAMDIDCQKNSKENKMLIAVRDYFQFAVNPAVTAALFFPILSYPLKFINDNLTAGHLTDMIVENLRHIIDLRRRDSSKRRIDLLQLMLDSELDESVESNRRGFTDAEIIANAHIFLLAGFETTSTALGYTFYLLALHQEIQDQLATEIISQVGDKENLSYDDVHGLTYLDQVFHESLRFYPPVVLFQTRECANDITINDVFIPKGTIVQAPVWQIHHDPDLWPEPDKFDPERFSPENRPKIPSMAFLPFGAGPRNCIGMRFSLLEAKLAIAKVIRRFKILPCDQTENPLKFSCPTVILNAENGIMLKISARD